MTLDQAIKQEKRRLTDKAKKFGIWEYFGQKEGRKLSDKYLPISEDFWSDSNKIAAFEEWASDFSL